MTNREPIEFGVWEVKKAGDKVFVAGMCYDSALKADDLVTQLYRLRPPSGMTLVELAERTDVDFVKSEQRNVHLAIEEIKIQGRAVAEVAPGHTAILKLSGEGVDLVTTKDVLGISRNRR